MSFDEYRSNQVESLSQRHLWLLRDPGSDFYRGGIAGEDLGKQAQADAPRFPARPIDKSGYPLYLSAANTHKIMTSAYYLLYSGILRNPQYNGMAVERMRTGKVRLPVGSVAVTVGCAVMCDPNPTYGELGTDIVRQYTRKTIEIRKRKTAAGAVDQPVTAPAAGDTTIAFDGLNANYGWQPGDTIHNSTQGDDVQIVSIVYTSATEGTITVKSAIAAGWADDDVLTNEHTQDAAIYFDCNDDNVWNHIKSLQAARLRDSSVPDIDNLVVATTALPGSGEIVLGTNYVLIDTVVAEDDVLFLDVEVWDDTIYKWTVGIAETAGAIRASATSATEVEVELV